MWIKSTVKTLAPLRSQVLQKTCIRNCTLSSHNHSQIRDLPVLPREVASALRPQDGQIFMDMTFGSGGHTKTLLASKADIKVIALDRDPEAYEKAVQLAQDTDFRVLPLLGRFSDAPELLKKIGIRHGQLSGIIMDVGPSVEQMEDPKRGFNVNLDGPLDMRMDGNRIPGMATAGDVINTLDTDSLTKIFRIYGESKVARKLAQSVVDARFMMMSIKSTIELSQLVSSVQGGEPRLDVQGRANSATSSVFQALRIFVNNELNEISYAMAKMREFLIFDPKVQTVPRVDKDVMEEMRITGGIMAILCSNRLEDTIVKDHVLVRNYQDMDDPYTQRPINVLETPTDSDMQKLANKQWLPLEKFVLFPGEEEILTNPTGKTTRLRCAMRRL